MRTVVQDLRYALRQLRKAKEIMQLFSELIGKGR